MPGKLHFSKLIFLIVPLLLNAAIPPCAQEKGEANAQKIERWGIFELSLKGPENGNPFTEVEFSVRFSQNGRVLEPSGFYDGDGDYRVRFMPDETGEWQYVTKSNRPALDGQKGRFTCVAASPGNHGPVRVVDTHRFAYADGTPHFSIGTTCYAWAHQGDAMEEQTLATLRDAPFNKIRMCVFPKSYTYNKNEPQFYPFEGKPLKDWDFTRFNPEFFQHFEKRVGQLRDMGIQADLILFHPYDRWGFEEMGAESDDRYLRYVVARFAAYRNVWWSMANEFDLMKSKKMSDWDRFFQVVRDSDPYEHLRGIHNCRSFYDHTKPWVTHVSIQSDHFEKIREWREQYQKPLVFDECKYEGNVTQGWGKLTGKEMTRRFWLGTIGGAYVGHGETYQHPKDLLWWSKGGVLRGQSPARIAFLKNIIAEAPHHEMTPDFDLSPGNNALVKPGEYYLVYFSEQTGTAFDLPGDRPYKIDGIDTWEMTVTSLGTAQPGAFSFAPPKADYLLRLTPYAPGEKPRPEAKASAEPTEGEVPLKVRFSAETDASYLSWNFGDGNGTSVFDKNPLYIYNQPGLYTATLTVGVARDLVATTFIPIVADRPAGTPIVRFGFPENEYPEASENHGGVRKSADGSRDFGPGGEPWKWITLGEKPLADLEDLKSFTLLGWVKPASLQVGPGGNRIIFTLNHNKSGIDLVCHADGRLRLAVNEWPDLIKNDSSPGKLKVGKWTFFAVAYDSTRSKESVRWYFGDANAPARLDRATNYNKGATGKGSGGLAIGNFNKTLRGAGLDRQFRGQIRALEIYGSRTGSNGALELPVVRKLQKAK